MSTARYLVGDVFDQLATIPDGSVDLVLTSPPFLALRSYLPDSHLDKAKEIGSEPTPAAFLDTLLDMTVEWRRVLAPHGSICVELGDTYSGSGGAGGDYGPVGLREGQPAFDGSAARTRSNRPSQYGTTSGPPRRTVTDAWPLPKSLTGIPTLYAWSLAYGRNLLRPEHTIDPWRVRNVVCWVRPNPPVGALGDKWRPATSFLTVATIATDRYFDLDATRSEPSNNSHGGGTWTTQGGADASRGEIGKVIANHAGAPPLDWWEIPTEPFRGSHYATWPRKLLTRPILAMCPQRVCTDCGRPSRRIVESDRVTPEGKGGKDVVHRSGGTWAARMDTERTTTGWTDCGHDSWRNGLVLDTFAGSGTTLAVATGLGRDAIGIDLDERNVWLARERVGMFLLEPERPGVDVHLPTEEGAA